MIQKLQTIRQMLLILLCCAVVGFTAFVIWLCIAGESYFSVTRRLQAQVLVVEGWIGRDSVRAAATEFKEHHYEYVVATGGFSGESETTVRSSYADLAANELLEAGVPADRLIVAPTGQRERQRTFESAVAVARTLESRGIRANAVNVFTLGPHARRSRLVYEKVNGPETKVGVIAWIPPYYKSSPWWLSKARATCLLKETVGYPYEVLFNAGRPAVSEREFGLHGLTSSDNVGPKNINR